jgi:tetratricopeptide (TPR) repeat protein
MSATPLKSRIPPRRALALAAALAAFAAAPVQARESAAVATPFEVGESPAGNYLAALIAGADRDTFAAATFFREALRFDPRNPQLVERAFVANLANGDFDAAFAFGERLLKLDASNGLAHLALGIRAIKAKKWRKARDHFGKSGSGRDRDLTATLLTAWTLVGSGETKRALEMVDQLRQESYAVFRNYHGALMADVGGHPAEALKRMTAAYDGEKNTLRLIDAYGRFMARRGETDEAKRAYATFAQALPRHPLIEAAQADLAAGRKLEPLVRNVGQGAAEALYGLGAAGGRQGDELAAMVYLRLALFLAPDNDLAIIALAEIYERLKQNERAIDAYEMIADGSPLRGTADIQTALVLDAMGKSEEATRRLEELLVRDPRDEDALAALGNLQRSRKMFVEAADTYGKAMAATAKPEKSRWPLYYFRGIAFERQKRWSAAEADFRKALELSPDQPLVLNYLGYSWVDQNMNLDEAFRLLRRAVELRPQDGYIVDSLGWALYRLGRYEEATKELEKAVDLRPSDPVINDHLGDAYWRIGRKLEAQFQWNHARDLKPEPEDLEKILKKIEHGLGPDKPAAAEAQPAKSGG